MGLRTTAIRFAALIAKSWALLIGCVLLIGLTSSSSWAGCGDYVDVRGGHLAKRQHAGVGDPFALTNGKSPVAPVGDGPACQRGNEQKPLPPAPSNLRLMEKACALLIGELNLASHDPGRRWQQRSATTRPGHFLRLERPPAI